MTEWQKRFITTNHYVLDPITQRSIYNIVINSDSQHSLVQNKINKRYSIDLDLITDTAVINNIFYIVENRVKQLNLPVPK